MSTSLWSIIYEQLIDLIAKPAGAGIGAHVWIGSGYSSVAEEYDQRQAICKWALEQLDVPYKLGVENSLKDEHPAQEDCSELVEMAYGHAGIKIPDGSNFQFDFCNPVQEPKPADLGFLWSDTWNRIGHVVIYLGSDQIIEARGGSVGKVRTADRSVIERDPRFRGWRRHPDFAWPIEDRRDRV